MTLSLPILMLAATATLAAQPPAALSAPAQALMQGRMADATALLAKAPATPATHLLLCRVDYAQNLTDPAVTECQAAANANPNDSATQLWLGRALGQKAAHASALSAFVIARHCREAFEKAVADDPSNPDAANDLAEFYIAAPGIVGGGKDKAAALATRIATSLPAASHRILALLAEKNGDLPKAEAEFKAAIAASKYPDPLIDLAHFYQTHARPDDAAATIKLALAANRNHGPADVDAASILTDANRDPKLAEQALRDYLNSSAQTDAAPVFKAHLALARLLAKQGDPAAAKAENVAAFALAPQYAPARKAVGQ